MPAKKKTAVTYIGTGRRKKSTARVFMTPGTGIVTVNGKSLEEYLPQATLRHRDYAADEPARAADALLLEVSERKILRLEVRERGGQHPLPHDAACVEGRSLRILRRVRARVCARCVARDARLRVHSRQRPPGDFQDGSTLYRHHRQPAVSARRRRRRRERAPDLPSVCRSREEVEPRFLDDDYPSEMVLRRQGA